MKIRNIVMIGVAAALVGATAACGGDDDSGLPTVTQQSTSSAAASTSAAATGYEAEITDGDKRPTVDVLNEMLQKALDPKIPAKDKTDLVEDSEVDPNLFNQLVKVAKENPDVTYKIKKPITGAGPHKANVKVEVKLPDNPPTKIDASIVYQDGRWKLSKSTVCPLLTANDVKTPLCTDGTSSTAKKKSATSKSAG
ncbi:MAG: hypothetical protein QM658_04850 [Gordonia sp. (in: high G+C Gram-positive bacteria)]